MVLHKKMSPSLSALESISSGIEKIVLGRDFGGSSPRPHPISHGHQDPSSFCADNDIGEVVAIDSMVFIAGQFHNGSFAAGAVFKPQHLFHCGRPHPSLETLQCLELGIGRRGNAGMKPLGQFFYICVNLNGKANRRPPRSRGVGL